MFVSSSKRGRSIRASILAEDARNVSGGCKHRAHFFELHIDKIHPSESKLLCDEEERFENETISEPPAEV